MSSILTCEWVFETFRPLKFNYFYHWANEGCGKEFKNIFWDEKSSNFEAINSDCTLNPCIENKIVMIH
jgi:hypothetical protein